MAKLRGTIVKPGGTIPKSGGTVPKPGGTVPKPGGTVPKPGGTMVKPNGTVAFWYGADGNRMEDISPLLKPAPVCNRCAIRKNCKNVASPEFQEGGR